MCNPTQPASETQQATAGGPPTPDSAAIEETYRIARARLLAEFSPRGFCEGRLSSSAVATAIASFALAQVDRKAHAHTVRAGLDWLVDDQHPDGGWGDSPESPTNLTATVLSWAALSLTEREIPSHGASAQRAVAWLAHEAGGADVAALRQAVLRRYGNDRTFACPILTMCALAGRLGPTPDAWALVPQLPFELAVLPHGLFRFLNLTVVSYALPALIAIGLARHKARPATCPVQRALRRAIEPRVLRIAEHMQPSNGGYEEATPLTGFVTMSLARAGHADSLTVRRAVGFLLASARPDGSWPIDTNLSTWLTGLSAVALLDEDPGDDLPPARREVTRRWLLDQQHGVEHPLTFGAPGGWAWSDLPGAMPDADDTAGTLIALRRLGAVDEPARAAARRAVRWLLDLQNRDGGIPTFSRGWGKLPFDRSCPDITAHALHAFVEWRNDLGDPSLEARLDAALPHLLRYLRDSQRTDGAWVPLWFGNQYAPGEENPTYATCRTALALEAAMARRQLDATDLHAHALRWLLAAQNADGGWGGARSVRSSVEETALAVAALATSGDADAMRRGCRWLAMNTDRGRETPPAPIGLYFAKLWYSERLYPLIFTVWALARAQKRQTSDA
jgi:squalene-hopene/tetraprenyl-beta-curcumene cyclase